MSRPICLALLGVVGVSTLATAEPARLSLRQILGYAAANPGIGAAREVVAASEARLAEARRAWLPQGTFTALVAPAPEVTCLPSEAECVRTDTIDVNQFSIGGVFTRLDLRMAAPIYTFGKLSGARGAAAAGVAAGQAQLTMARRDIVYDVTRAYYGLKLAREILFTIEEGQDYLKKVITRIETQLESGKGDATEIDRLRLRVLEAEIDARVVEARRLADTTLAVLHTLATGAPEGFDVDETPLEPTAIDLKGSAYYVDLARRHRPEVQALDAGVRARRALEDLEWARFWPDLALVGTLSWAYAPSVDDPENFFANDPFNTFSAGFGALLTLQLDHPLKAARYQRVKAELREMQQKRRQALSGMDLEVEKSVAELAETRARMEATARGEKAARAWLVATYQNLMLGLSEPKDITDALLAFFTLRLRYLQSVYDLNAGIAQLERVIGGTRY